MGKRSMESDIFGVRDQLRMGNISTAAISKLPKMKSIEPPGKYHELIDVF